MQDSFNKIISEANSVLILVSKEPDFDQVASALSLFLSYKDKKEVSISCPTPMRVEFNRLVGVNKIETELGNKNMVIAFSEYDASNIERISSDVSGSKLSLRVIPKPGNKPPQKEQVEISYAGVAADVVILVGGADDRAFPALNSKDFAEPKLIHIGTNELNLSSDREVISFSKPAASISEIVYELIGGESLDGDIATNLLTGLYQGSNDFSNSGVTYETFRIAAELMKAGGKHKIEGEQATQKLTAEQAKALSGVDNRKQEERKAPESVEGESTNPPKAWMQPPKIMKGTSGNS